MHIHARVRECETIADFGLIGSDPDTPNARPVPAREALFHGVAST
jgi:hypothetical protein